jgi:serine phosphatase RsbU (regulator of sigma subunit)
MGTLNLNSLDWSAAVAALDPEKESGDSYLAHPSPHGMLFAAVDGLGHGSKAAAVSRIAIEVLARHPSAPLEELFTRCHDALRLTRGATMSLAAINTVDATLSWIGVGNVEGMLLRADRRTRDERLLLRNGVVGLQLPMLQTAVQSVSQGDLLVLVTDGVTSDFAQTIDMDAAPRAIAEQILAKNSKGSDDALALVARYRGKVT